MFVVIKKYVNVGGLCRQSLIDKIVFRSVNLEDVTDGEKGCDRAKMVFNCLAENSEKVNIKLLTNKVGSIWDDVVHKVEVQNDMVTFDREGESNLNDKRR